MLRALRLALMAYVLFAIGFTAMMLFGSQRPQPTAKMPEMRPTYQDIADEVNKVDSVNADCRPTWNNLSPHEQIRRVNEVLGTPSEPDQVLRR